MCVSRNSIHWSINRSLHQNKHLALQLCVSWDWETWASEPCSFSTWIWCYKFQNLWSLCQETLGTSLTVVLFLRIDHEDPVPSVFLFPNFKPRCPAYWYPLVMSSLHTVPPLMYTVDTDFPHGVLLEVTSLRSFHTPDTQLLYLSHLNGDTSQIMTRIRTKLYRIRVLDVLHQTCSVILWDSIGILCWPNTAYRPKVQQMNTREVVWTFWTTSGVSSIPTVPVL